jgi:DNA-binding IclR family transcriptional regulator
MRQNPTKTNSIDKTLMILSCFAPHNHEYGTVEISHRLGFHKATVSRILLTLTRHGFLSQNPVTRKFTLGPAVMSLSRALRQSLRTNMVQAARPFADELRDNLKETVILEVFGGKSTFMAYIAEGPRLVRLAGAIGDTLPIHASAGAKAILAFLPEERKKALLKGRLKRFTRNTIADRRKLEVELRDIRRKGVSYDREEIDEGTGAIGVPVFDHEQRPQAALVVAGPYQRIKENGDTRIVSALRAASSRISSSLYAIT